MLPSTAWRSAVEAEDQGEFHKAVFWFERAAKLYERQNEGLTAFSDASWARAQLLNRLLRTRAEARCASTPGKQFGDGGEGPGRRPEAGSSAAAARGGRTSAEGAEGAGIVEHLPEPADVFVKPGNGSVPNILRDNAAVPHAYLKESREAAAADLLLLEDDLDVLKLPVLGGSRNNMSTHQQCGNCHALAHEVDNLRRSLRAQRKMDAFVKEYELKLQRFRESTATYKEESLRRKVRELQELVGALVRRLEKVEKKER